MGKLKYLVLHCTATPEGREVTADEIRRWHTSAPPVGRGWKQVGYTDMIHLDGRVERLVDNNEDAQVDSWEITNGAKGTTRQLGTLCTWAVSPPTARPPWTPAPSHSGKRWKPT